MHCKSFCQLSLPLLILPMSTHVHRDKPTKYTWVDQYEIVRSNQIIKHEHFIIFMILHGVNKNQHLQWFVDAGCLWYFPPLMALFFPLKSCKRSQVPKSKLPWPLFRRTSGAMYSWAPMIELATPAHSSFASAKMMIIMISTLFKSVTHETYLFQYFCCVSFCSKNQHSSRHATRRKCQLFLRILWGSSHDLVETHFPFPWVCIYKIYNAYIYIMNLKHK